MTAKPAPQALYRQARAYIEQKISSGELKAGDRVPSENELVETLGMSRMTVNRALRELTTEGQLTRLPGVGTFVADRKPQSNLLMIANIADEIQQRGHEYSFKIISSARESAPIHIAAALDLPTGHSVFHLLCVHYENGIPVQLEDRYVNPLPVPGFLDQPYGNDLQPSRYLLETVPAEEMEHIVDATLPTAQEAEILETGVQDPCLELTRRTWSDGRVVTFVRFLHPSSRYRLGSRFAVNSSNQAS